MNKHFTQKTLLFATVLVVLTTASASAVDPYRQTYRYDRRAVDQSFDQSEVALRHGYKAAREQEEDAWKAARRHAPPAVRRSMDQQYRANKRSLAQSYSAQRKALDRAEDDIRDALRDDYRRSVRAPVASPRFVVEFAPAPIYARPNYAQPTYVPPHFVPSRAPALIEELPPPEAEYRGPVYDDRAR
jgi:hypothetical protein